MDLYFLAFEEERGWYEEEGGQLTLRENRLNVDIPDTEFTRYFSRDDCFCTRCAECTFDPMDRKTRMTHTSHEYRDFVIR